MTRTLGNESILTSVRNKMVTDYAVNKYLTKKKVQETTKNAIDKVKSMNLNSAFKGAGNATKLSLVDSIYRSLRNDGLSLDYKLRGRSSTYRKGNTKGILTY